MGKLFGTDGVRGIANIELTCELAYKLGRIGAFLLTKGNKGKIVVGKDTRISGDMLEAALTAGILSAGVDVISVGVIPTPGVAYLTRKYNASAGVVISASHNPVEYNGIKFFNQDGYKLPDEVEDEIERYIFQNIDIDPIPRAGEIGTMTKVSEGIKDYSEFLKGTINVDLKGLKIATDCGNGAAYQVAPMTLEALGAEVKVINDRPDGLNINFKCGSTNPEVIQRFVLETGADVGLSFDGDADRLIAVDEKGEIVDGDKIMAICGLHLKEKGKLNKDTIVATVMSNMGLEKAVSQYDCKVVKTKVGDRYVLEKMMEEGYSLGGEQSGHIIFLEHNTTGDGILTALQLMAVMKERGKKLSELASVMTVYPQVLKNARVSNENKNKFMEDEEIANKIREIEELLKGEGRILIRPSGTEPLVRVMMEGKDIEVLEKYTNELVEKIEEKFRG